MAKKRAQRIGIWIITIILTVGTIGSFFMIVLANENQMTEQERQQADYEKQLEEYQKQVAEQQKQNAENSEPLDGYSADPWNQDEALDLKVAVLKEGNGQELKATDTINASYFGWLSDGTIFDSTNKKDADDMPATFSLQQVIEGWTEGLTGQKVGSVVELTIPSDQAYGAQESAVIPANAPLRFIVIIHGVEVEEA